jgi:hypothetical protein
VSWETLRDRDIRAKQGTFVMECCFKPRFIPQHDNVPDHIFLCPYLNSVVHLTSERIEHIRAGHPEMKAMEEVAMTETIQSAIEMPSIIIQSRKDAEGVVFARWEPHMYGGKYIVVAVITSPERNWVITAFIARKIPKGIILWTRD